MHALMAVVEKRGYVIKIEHAHALRLQNIQHIVIMDCLIRIPPAEFGPWKKKRSSLISGFNSFILLWQASAVMASGVYEILIDIRKYVDRANRACLLRNLRHNAIDRKYRIRKQQQQQKKKDYHGDRDTDRVS